jgi:deoxyribonuclease IV
MFGYHVSIVKKSFKKSIENSHKTSNINAFQIFISSPLQLKIVNHDENDAIECKKYIEDNNLFLVSHASYLINSANKDKWEHKINVTLSDLLYAEKIGALGSVFHVGKYLNKTVEEGIQNMFDFISTIIHRLQSENSKSIYILETPAACGTELLSDIKDLGTFFNKFSKKQKENLKICIDTCHVFSAGYSLQSKNEAKQFIKLVEEFIGWNNVVLIHLNDSKKECGCHVDRHENLCHGCIGKNDETGMEFFVKHCFNKNIPFILETPDEFDKYHSQELEKIRSWI